MDILFYVYAALTTIIVVLQLTKHWLLRKGALWWVYRLNLVIFTGYFITETILATTNPAQAPLIFMNIVNVWAFTMSYLGMRRLQKEEKIAKDVEKEKACL